MLQDIYEASDVQRYPIGFKFPVKKPLDLRSFYYGKAANDQIPDVGSHISLTQHVSWAVVADAPVGSKTVVVTVGSDDGAAHNGAILADELAGGYITLTPHTANHVMLRLIMSNTAVLAPGGAMTVTLDKPTIFVLELVSHAECMANPFLDLWSGNLPRQPIMGIPTIAAKAGQFLWYQTWGPTWAAPQTAGAGDIAIGVGDHNVQVVFRHDGSLQAHAVAEAYATKQQHAGFVMTIPNGAGQAAPFVFLQITP